MRKPALITLLLLLLMTTRLFGGVNMIIEHYSVEQGLPNNVVSCSMKDRDGFIWFGTWYGLCRFDGVKFRTYDKFNLSRSAVPPRKIQRMVEDKNGFIWIKTIDRKLYMFNKQTETYHAVLDDMRNYSDNIQVVKLQSTADGDILLLTRDKNLLLAQTDKDGEVSIKVLFDSKDEVEPQTYRMRCNKLSETSDYISWIGTDYKVMSFRKGKALASRPSNYITTKMGYSSDNALTSMCGEGNKMWIGSNDGTFYSVDTNSGAVEKYNSPELKGAILNIYVTPSGRVYMAVSGQGMYEYSLGERKAIKLKLSIDETLVTNTYIDRYDKMWFHENERALVYYDPQNGISKRFQFGVTGKTSTLTVEDAGERGLFFLSPGGEVMMFDRENLRMVDMNDMKEISGGQQEQKFLHLFQDRETGSLWLASSTQGVYKVTFPHKQFKLWIPSAMSEAQKHEAPGIRAIYQTRNGDIWVGTRWQNLYLMDRNGKLKHVFSNNAERVGVVYSILEDKDGNIWFATKGDGLVKAVPDDRQPGGFRFTRFSNVLSDKRSISGNEVYSIYQDRRGRIWVGLLDGGLNLLVEENGQVTFKNKNNGFVNYPSHGLYMEVRDIVEDNDGRIWVGTMDGLMSFDSNFDTPEQIDFEIYHRKGQYSMMDIDVNNLYKDSNSQIWISMFGGGLSRLTGYDKSSHMPEFKSYEYSDVLNSEVIKSIIEDTDKRLWFATETGLSYYDMNSGRIRNFDKYDGFPLVNVEDNAAICTDDGELWIGCAQGLLSFSPNKIESQYTSYNTFIVGCEISNKDIGSYADILDKSISYADGITLEHNQSMFTFEFAALNFNNQNRVSYRYILEGYEKEWHYNGKNRIASYTNVPPGRYVFRVETLDEANPDLASSRSLAVTILPPWWESKIAYVIYAVIVIILLYLGVRLSLFMIRVKNDVYIEQRLSELKIKFFTNISHELRTPLTLIIGPIQELKEKEELSAKGRQYVELMERNVNQMLQLVNQLLDFRKIQNGKMRLHVSLFDISEMIASFEKEFRVLANENEVSFTFQLPNEPVKVWADKDKIAIVVRNILSNAFKFTSQGGNVFVSVEAENGDNSCVIKVEDDGIGIPQSKLSEIFERFAQVDSAHSTNYRGTGIGLALSKEIVNMHHGKLYAESVEGKGSTFVIELRMDREHYNASEVDFYMSEDNDARDVDSKVGGELVEEEQKRDVKVDGSLPSLLIVEDNKDLCDMLKLLLDDKFNIYTACDGVDGLKKIHLYHPDIVVTDQMMPNMDGLKMLQRIREDFKISHIPVIILTAKGDDENKTKAISMGANAYITKPFSKEYLVARIEQLLKERKLFLERVWHTRVTEEESTREQTAEKNYEQYLVKKDVQFIEKIHQVIEDNIENSEFNISDMANMMGLSRSAYFKKVKSLTGYAPVDLVKDIRLNKSLELIKTTDMTIAEIAFAVGFKDSGYFSKCFRKKFNQSPKEYINEWRKS
jgi:signal transduction histidine kinase/ligand-binding sensor domain-containing protein/DNA-binding response OmpR family regulator